MEKWREGQKELHCVFIDLEKAYDRVPREELWECMRQAGVPECYVESIQDMYKGARTSCYQRSYDVDYVRVHLCKVTFRKAPPSPTSALVCQHFITN